MKKRMTCVINRIYLDLWVLLELEPVKNIYICCMNKILLCFPS
ncbi:unnamed protein product [Arabidopsis halleri]